MRKFLIICALISPQALLAQTSVDDPLPVETIEANHQDEAYKAVKHYFKTVKTLQATFLQRNSDGSNIEGMLSMERPGRIRFDYGKDSTMLIVSDGKTLNMVDYEIGKVTRWPVNDTPLKILLDSELDLTGAGASILPNINGIDDIIELVASNPEKPEQGEVTLYFRVDTRLEEGLVLDSWRVIDTKYQETRVALLNNMVNAELNHELWKYEDPRGLAKRKRARR